jgi:hypothetical protein
MYSLIHKSAANPAPAIDSISFRSRRTDPSDRAASSPQPDETRTIDLILHSA